MSDITSAQRSAPLVEVHDLQKNYGAIQALRGVDVAFSRGLIHGLVGANGAGKSTLVRSLAGLEQPDGGEIVIRGEATKIANPGEAGRLGFAFIYQELNLVDTFTASQNIILGSDDRRGFQWKGFRGIPSRVAAVAARVGIDFDLDTPVADLTVHQQWLVSIARALVQDCELIAMDEPTASLDAEEASRLLKVARDLAAQGVAVIFISHRLDEIIDICDHVTVFKDGEVSLSIDRSDVTRQKLVEAIVGRSIQPGENKDAPSAHHPGDVFLAAENVGRGKTLRRATIAVRKGELLGIAGLVGSGRTELARVIFGADRPDSGSMTLGGKPYAPKSISDAIRHRVAYVPEERRSEALFLGLSVMSNLHITTWLSKLIPGTPFVSTKRARSAAVATTERLGVVLRNGGVSQPISGLSGGNQQKVVIGRWLQAAPELLILDEPTRGVDVGARSDIYERIREIARDGTAVIVISSDFEELLECDRVTVISGGKTAGNLVGPDITVDSMLHLCYAQ